MKRLLATIFVLSVLSPLNIYSRDMNTNIFQELFGYAYAAHQNSMKHCSIVPEKNKNLLETMKMLEEKARKKNSSTFNTMNEAVTLLNMLQDQIEKVCGKVALVDESTIKTIIANEADILISSYKSSGNFKGFLSAVYETEYSKLLYILTMGKDLGEMHVKWAEIMSAKRQSPDDAVKNVRKANKYLAGEIRKQILLMETYYEGRELKIPEKKENGEKKSSD